MLILEKAKIYGVDNVGGASPALVRTDDALGLSYSVGESEIESDFNYCYPWSDMQEVSDSENNVFIKIPKFYSRVMKNINGTTKYQISGVRYQGFSTLFIDGKGNEIDYILVGKYEGSGTSSKVFSKSGQTVLVNITLASFRTGCKANGAGYQQYDFLIDAIIKQLFLIEFATSNSQSIMYGYVAGSNSAAVITGHTDSVRTASGSPTSNSTGTYSCKYRGIENLWGNTWTFCDGLSFVAEKIYLCANPNQYESGKATLPYTYVANRPMSSGYLKTIKTFDKFPLLGYTAEIGASDSIYYCDYIYQSSGGAILLVGGRWFSGGAAGLWDWDGDFSAGISYSYIGGRLCQKPL